MFVPKPIPDQAQAHFTVNFGTLTEPITWDSYPLLVGCLVTPLSQEAFVVKIQSQYSDKLTPQGLY